LGEQLLPLDGPFDSIEQLSIIEGLREKIVGTELHSLDSRRHIPVSGNHDHGDLRGDLLDLLQRLHSPASGHSQIHEDHLGSFLFDPLHGLLPIFGGDDLETLFSEKAGEDPAHIGLIIDGEDLWHHEPP
jgi:hypothetical protein